MFLYVPKLQMGMLRQGHGIKVGDVKESVFDT